MSEPALPSYADDELAALDVPALIELMVKDEDRVPRNVIDACVRAGEEMVEALERVIEDGVPWREESPGEWWLGVHAAMILGLIPGERAGLVLARFMRRMAETEDENLQEWLSGYWPALFENKPDSVLPALRDICVERTFDWYPRANAMDPVIAAAERRGGEALENALEWLAATVADEDEDWMTRLTAGNLLLDFPRGRYRPLLEELARKQGSGAVHFSLNDVQQAYTLLPSEPEWHRRNDPWEFYRPEQIARRQERWAEEDAADPIDAHELPEVDREDDLLMPYVRGAPKVGRNDPCPCGSGRKYKKCCLRGPAT